MKKLTSMSIGKCECHIHFSKKMLKYVYMYIYFASEHSSDKLSLLYLSLTEFKETNLVINIYALNLIDCQIVNSDVINIQLHTLNMQLSIKGK